MKSLSRYALPLLLLAPISAYAGRYEMERGDGFEYLFWIPIILAGSLYKKYEKSGNGGLAALVGGGLGLLFIYFFPLISAIIVGILMLLVAFSVAFA